LFGGHDIRHIAIEDVETLHITVNGPVQANRAVAVFSAILGFAVDRRLLIHNPARGVHRNREKGKEFFYNPTQCKAIVDTALKMGTMEAKYIALCLLTGCRPGELLESGPSWRQGSVLRTPDGKTGARTIFLSPPACAILDGFVTADDDWYFPAGMSLRRTWERVCRDAGVPQARLYDLRHTFASAALAAGESVAVIGQMLGHKKYQTTLRYAHLAPDVGLNAAAAAAERMLTPNS
jgi:integrase